MSCYHLALVMLFFGCVFGADKCTPTATDVLGPMSSYTFPTKSAVCPSTSSNQIEINGRVLDEDCKAVSGIKLQVWQTDSKGVYTKDCRAELTTDKNGKYSFTTVKPGLYSFGSNTRPSHIHFQAFKGTKSALISQIYFKGGRACDAWAGAACQTTASHITLNGAGKATFDIILRKSALLAESDDLMDSEMAIANGENTRDMVPLGQETSSKSSVNWIVLSAGIYGAVGIVSMIVGAAFYIRSRRANQEPLYQEMMQPAEI